MRRGLGRERVAWEVMHEHEHGNDDRQQDHSEQSAQSARRSRRRGDIAPAIGGRIRRARRALGLSQAALGAAVGIDQPRVSRLEKGVTVVSADLLRRLAGALGVSVDWLLSLSADGGPAVPGASSEPALGALDDVGLGPELAATPLEEEGSAAVAPWAR